MRTIQHTSSNLITSHLPTIGILSFAILYLYSASLYPGGSQANLDSIGFDWVNNYWCDLMHHEAGNGLPNPASPYAIFAMFLLCSSMLIFFFKFSKTLIHGKKWQAIIQVGGTISMVFAALIFTDWHNQMIILASLFGLIPSIGIIIGVAKSNMTFYQITGILCIFLLILNNLFYYTSICLSNLPLLQKITFAIVLLWVIGLNGELNSKTNRSFPQF